MPGGYDFDDEHEAIVTPWGDILPPVSFSSEQLALIRQIAVQPSLEHTDAVVILAHYLGPKLTFNPGLGCWDLPLVAEYDATRHARYPLISVKELGYNRQLAHRATVETFLGHPLPINAPEREHVDHRCRRHACCNPYHLEVVTPQTNNLRKVGAIKRLTRPELFQLAEGPITFGELAVMGAVDLGIKVDLA